MKSKIFNFSAGPAILPLEVFQKASQVCLEYDLSSLSILEMSHRSKPIINMVSEATELIKDQLEIPEGYQVIFLQGGASQQFCMIPFNLLNQDEVGAYVNTGVWSQKAIKEAQIISQSVEIGSSKEKGFTFIPKNLSIPKDARYVHITTNNTIYGTQYHKFPKVGVPLIADMSSDIFSRKIAVKDFDLIYAGAQKNMGTAGVTIVIVKESILGKTTRPIPAILDYRLHIKSESMLNTPPVFSIYVVLETLKWLKSQGGVNSIEKINIEKAKLLYKEIDSNPLFENNVALENRSQMNVTFTLKNKEKEANFIDFVTKNGIGGIKGHRSTGGFRASIYNAMPLDGIHRLVEVMQKFEI